MYVYKKCVMFYLPHTFEIMETGKGFNGAVTIIVITTNELSKQKEPTFKNFV